MNVPVRCELALTGLRRGRFVIRGLSTLLLVVLPAIRAASERSSTWGPRAREKYVQVQSIKASTRVRMPLIVSRVERARRVSRVGPRM